MTLLQRFQQYISDNHLFSTGDTLLLAVSGGIDSVVLCELCKQAGYSFIIAHCNFKLRADESERDAAFVQQLAQNYKVPFLRKEFDTASYAQNHKLSIQEAARELRYGWFAGLLNPANPGRSGQAGRRQTANLKPETWNLEPGTQQSAIHDSRFTIHDLEPGNLNLQQPTVLLTAHHLDDNIETMLMHFFRGTGIHGLRGMLPKKGQIVRPLLFARKQELKQFATDNNLNWVEDSSNALDKYSRNYFRNQLIPLVQNIYPEAENNLAGNLRRFVDMEQLYEQALAVHKKKLLEYKGEEVHIPILKLQKSEPLHSIVYEIISGFGFSAAQVDEVIKLLGSESGRYVQSATHRIIKNRRWLIIAAAQTEQAQTLAIDADEDRIVFENGALELTQINSSNVQLVNDPAIALIDQNTLQFPLLLRKWKKGDYFYPLGLKKKKKLARFFIDQKLSMTDKEKVWVLESNKKILWVVGLRIDDRFKITGSTKQVLRIQFTG
ncbi:tRNA lysidine(34) synthetase TilS [Niastella koreensis]|uniref:tRNA(Ile)-lysidine synthase n=2 Tax=Niastella koreensis TaxID=354356 RepID=G8TDG3_NIAKG|nr:tRNA lysidine(34) synthetase TilS [Niastella koreensis]AEW00413.1 tRNA(Ile)-lysidine synthase [Niastella koreensis GR20-10]OQP52279.1 tRNA lysidine(34) synthetase TilS [Niastella koreensis]